MREIKFRGMDIQGRWFYGNLAIVPKDNRIQKQGHYISNSAGMPFAYQIRPETVGQYAGLNDKAGKPIYEGDILKLKDYHGERIVTVNFHNGLYYYGGDGFSDEYLINSRDREVIGNIWENPELCR